jgi:hypothetical protein
MDREKWVERILTGVSAVVGLLVIVAALVIGLSVVVWIEKAPEFLAIVIAAGMVSAALYFRKPPQINNLAMSHPDTVEIMESIRRVLIKVEARK